MRILLRMFGAGVLALGLAVNSLAWGDSHLPAPPSPGGAIDGAEVLDPKVLDPRQTIYREGLAAFDQGDFDRAYVVWKPLAENGYAIAQYSLAKLYDSGGGAISRNPLQAALWYRQAAAQGVTAAQNNLAIMYARGRGVPQSAVRAVQLWRQAAEGGHAMAKYNLALSYFNGDGLAADREAAVDWFLRAGEAGVPEAQFALGQLFRQGIGLPQDGEAALGWYQAAADQGHGEAARQAALLRDAGVRIATHETAEPAASGTTADADRPAPPVSGEAAPLEPTELSQGDSPAGQEAEDIAAGAAEAEPANRGGDETEAAAAAAVEPDDVDPEADDAPTAADETAADESATDTIAEDETLPVQDQAVADQADEARDGEDPDNADKAEEVTDIADQTAAIPATEDPALAPADPVADTPSHDPDLPPRPGRKPTEALAMLAPQASGIDARVQPPRPGRKPDPSRPADGSAAAEGGDAARHVPLQTEPFPKGSFAVWLASTANRHRADAFWGKAKTSYPEIFDGVTPRITRVDLGDLGIFFRLTAGPIVGKNDAETVCRQLRVHQPDAFCKIRSN